MAQTPSALLEIGIISLFPEMFTALDVGIPGRAQKQGLLTLSHFNPRDFTQDKHRTVDDRPYGGGPGMVMLAEPLTACIQQAKQALGPAAKLIYLSPQGRRLDHQATIDLSQRQQMLLLAGRYEGVDQRVLDNEVDEHWSIGDYVLSGGELAAMVMIDAITRHLPGALGHSESAEQDSFATGLLDHPHYTRPEVFAGIAVPKVLLSGDHAAIKRWRAQQALGQTWLHRPDLLEQRELTQEEQQLLQAFKHEYERSQS